MTVLIGNRRGASCSGQQPLEYATIDRRQRLEIGDGDALVELVDRRVDRPELDDLGANVGDEAAVGRASGAGELGRDAADLAYRRAGDVDQPAARASDTACRSRSSEARNRGRAWPGPRSNALLEILARAAPAHSGN